MQPGRRRPCQPTATRSHRASGAADTLSSRCCEPPSLLLKRCEPAGPAPDRPALRALSDPAEIPRSTGAALAHSVVRAAILSPDPASSDLRDGPGDELSGGDEPMRSSAGGSGVDRPSCCRPPCTVHTNSARRATAGLTGRTSLAPTMAETRPPATDAASRPALLPSVLRPFGRRPVGSGRLRRTIPALLEGCADDLVYSRSEPHARALLVLLSVLCGEVAEWLKAAVLKTARR